MVSGVLVGGFLGYVAGAYLACGIFRYGGNLCGLIGVFITGPLGGIAGGIGGTLAARRPDTPPSA
jgi:hypothetical protein